MAGKPELKDGVRPEAGSPPPGSPEVEIITLKPSQRSPDCLLWRPFGDALRHNVVLPFPAWCNYPESQKDSARSLSQ